MKYTNLEYRVATVDDAPAIAALIQDGFRAPDNRPGWTGDLDDLAAGFTTTAEEQHRNIKKPDMMVILMENQAGLLVGTVAASKRVDGKGDSGYVWLSMLAVDTSLQQSGFGR